jgi:hypothetical protein
MAGFSQCWARPRSHTWPSTLPAHIWSTYASNRTSSYHRPDMLTRMKCSSAPTNFERPSSFAGSETRCWGFGYILAISR